MGAQWKAKGKELAANAKGKLFGRLAKDIMIAARNGADPSANSRLRLVVEQARKVSMPKETLERAIKKGAGLLGDAVSFDRVIYEGFAPHQVPVMIEVLTDNVNRSASEMRVLFRKGQLGTSGSVSWDFDHVGFIEAEPAQAGADAELAARLAQLTPQQFRVLLCLADGLLNKQIAHELGLGNLGKEMGTNSKRFARIRISATNLLTATGLC